MSIKYYLFLTLLKSATNFSVVKQLLNFLRKMIVIFKPKFLLGDKYEYQRIYHFHIQKTAGTSLNASFYEAESASYEDSLKKQFTNLFTRSTKINNKIFTDHNISLINNNSFYYAWSHYPFEDVSVDSNTFTFTSLRDPADRLLSFYNFLLDIDKNKNLTRYQHMSHLTKFLGDSFDEFFTNLPINYKLSQIYMFSKQLNLDEAIENISKVDFIIMDNNIDQFKTCIKRIFDLDLEIKELNVSKSKSKVNIKKFDLEIEYSFYNFIKRNIDFNNGKLLI